MGQVDRVLGVREADQEGHHVPPPLLPLLVLLPHAALLLGHLLHQGVGLPLVIPHPVPGPLPAHPLVGRLLLTVHHWLHPRPVLRVRLAKVDQTKPVLHIWSHVLHPEIEPAAVSVRVEVSPHVKLVVCVCDPHSPHQVPALESALEDEAVRGDVPGDRLLGLGLGLARLGVHVERLLAVFVVETELWLGFVIVDCGAEHSSHWLNVLLPPGWIVKHFTFLRNPINVFRSIIDNLKG